MEKIKKMGRKAYSVTVNTFFFLGRAILITMAIADGILAAKVFQFALNDRALPWIGILAAGATAFALTGKVKAKVKIRLLSAVTTIMAGAITWHHAEMAVWATEMWQKYHQICMGLCIGLCIGIMASFWSWWINPPIPKRKQPKPKQQPKQHPKPKQQPKQPAEQLEMQPGQAN